MRNFPRDTLSVHFKVTFELPSERVASAVFHHTGRSHREKLARKLGCSAAAQLTCYALQCGYVSTEEVP